MDTNEQHGQRQRKRKRRPPSRSALVYTVAEVAEMLRLSRQSCYTAIKNNELPGITIGDRIVVPKILLHRRLGLPDDGIASPDSEQSN